MDTARLVDIFRGHDVDTVIDIFALEPAQHRAGARGDGRDRRPLRADQLGRRLPQLWRAAPQGAARRSRPSRPRKTIPLRDFRYPYRGNDAAAARASRADLFDDYDKIILEEAARGDTRFETTVLRPPMIFGPGDKQRRFAWAIDAVEGRRRRSRSTSGRRSGPTPTATSPTLPRPSPLRRTTRKPPAAPTTSARTSSAPRSSGC